MRLRADWDTKVGGMCGDGSGQHLRYVVCNKLLDVVVGFGCEWNDCCFAVLEGEVRRC